ncbi:MAG: hypothetical protein AVDCRST_MAG54-4263, partial [uncultured Actinomycetospora sp.]
VPRLHAPPAPRRHGRRAAGRAGRRGRPPPRRPGALRGLDRPRPRRAHDDLDPRARRRGTRRAARARRPAGRGRLARRPRRRSRGPRRGLERPAVLAGHHDHGGLRAAGHDGGHDVALRARAPLLGPRRRAGTAGELGRGDPGGGPRGARAAHPAGPRDGGVRPRGRRPARRAAARPRRRRGRTRPSVEAV